MGLDFKGGSRWTGAVVSWHTWCLFTECSIKRCFFRTFIGPTLELRGLSFICLADEVIIVFLASCFCQPVI